MITLHKTISVVILIMVKSLAVLGSIAVIVVAMYITSKNNSDKTSLSNQTPTNSQAMHGDGQNVMGHNVNYYNDSFGYFAKPSDSMNYPGVIMIHEWWGLNDNIRNMADSLAAEGYQVLAVDLYDGKVAETPERARELTGSLDQKEALQNLKAAKTYLTQNNASKIASLGWCFGGGQSMQLSLAEDLDATVIYYGNLVTNEESLNNIDWPVLGIFGSEDQSIPVDTVREFEQSLNNLNIENSIHIYEGVGHAFANPSGANYAPEETQDAWNKTLQFLDENIKS